MDESATEVARGSSLEEILLRHLDRFGERPALLDREEFAAHIASAFDGDVPAESFVERFFAGNPEVAAAAPDVAHAFVASVGARLDFYQFDLSGFEFVVIENAQKIVVAGDAGQVEARVDERVREAIRSAVISGADLARAADGHAREPRAYLLRERGAVELLDAKKLASALAPSRPTPFAASASRSPSPGARCCHRAGARIRQRRRSRAVPRVPSNAPRWGVTCADRSRAARASLVHRRGVAPAD